MRHFLPLLITIFFFNIHAEYRVCNKIELESDFNVNRCKDGSISFEQPDAPKTKGKKSTWNGQCGAVAASNVFHAYCKKFYRVSSIYNRYFTEIINTPGIRPSTLTVGLNEAFDDDENCLQGTWRYHNTDNRYDFIRILKKHVTRQEKTHWEINVNGKKQFSRPAIALISKNKGSILHYVTVVNIRGTMSFYSENKEFCEVTYNDFGSQKTATCDEFADWASQADDGIWTGLLLYKYNYILFR